MVSKKKSETTPNKVKLVNRMVFLGTHVHDDFNIMIQIIGNICQYVIFQRGAVHPWYQGYVEDTSHPSDFDYLSLGKEELMKISATLMEKAIGHCNTVKNYQEYLEQHKNDKKESTKKRRHAKHINLDITKQPLAEA